MPHAPKRKMLLLTGSLGDGHKQAALALQETAAMLNTGLETDCRDFLEWTQPYLHEVSRYLFLKGVSTFPNVYGYLFQKTRSDNSLSHMFKKFRLYGVGRMMQLLEETKPSVVVSTFPSAAAAISMMKVNGLTEVPAVTVITDHTDHSYWIHPMTDRYIVGSVPVLEALVRRGVDRSRISVTGIPVRPQFHRKYDKRALRRKYGLLSETPVVLIMGGGCGLLGEGVAELLAQNNRVNPVQYVVVCGSNRKLFEQLSEAVAEAGRRHVHVYGFVQEIHELMAMSDLLITKPGGLTTSEAVAQALPMLLCHALPGQEQDNARILEQAGFAAQVRGGRELIGRLQLLLREPSRLASMKLAAEAFGGSHAAERAIDAILHTCNSANGKLARERILVGGGV